MDFGSIFMFLGIALLSGLSCKNAAIGMIGQINTVSRYYPKHYMAPGRRMKKLFKLSQRVIPRYLYFELLLSLFFFLLGPLNIVIWMAFHCGKTAAAILVMVHVCLILLNLVFFLITSLLFKRG